MLIKKKMGMIAIVVLLVATVVIYANPIPSAGQPKSPRATTATQIRVAVPIATSGSIVYMAWPNNDTGHWNVFFAKSIAGGKTLKTTMLSALNKGQTVDLNTEIAASGSNVYVTWWTNKSRVLMPLFGASNDSGNTFAKPIMLNSTG